MELFYLPDCAIELVQIACREGIASDWWNISHLIDLLVPNPKGKKAVSYNRYIKRYLKSLEDEDRVKQFLVRVLPLPVRNIIRACLGRYIK